MDEKVLLEEFLEFIIDVYTDRYGHLEVCKTGDELDPTIERVVEHFLKEIKK